MGAVLLGGCTGATLNGYDAPLRVASMAVPQDVASTLQATVGPLAKAHPGMSGYRVLANGENSLYARLYLVRMAEKTLDLQYYAMADDFTSNTMAAALIRAGERGVRVRLLIDGFTVSGMANSLAALDAAENIDVRVFNPAALAHKNILQRWGGMLAHATQLNKRMHNKALIADNQMAVMGGRNLGDAYFDADSDLHFQDVDLLTAGPVTDALSRSFDQYWNDTVSYPLADVHHRKLDRKGIAAARKVLEQTLRGHFPTSPTQDKLDSLLAQARLQLVWAPGYLLADDPGKVRLPRHQTQSVVMDGLLDLTNHAQQEFIAVPSYFVPLDDGVAWLAGIRRRGVEVKVLTNSLAATDVVAAHAGYQAYRPGLLKEGVDLYELKATAPVGQRLLARDAASRAGLHAKVYMVDRRYAMVGSFNLDPRSIDLNTEMAVVIDSPELTGSMREVFHYVTTPEQSYRLGLADNGRTVVWRAREDGHAVIYTCEPNVGFWRRAQNVLFSLLPLDSQL